MLTPLTLVLCAALQGEPRQELLELTAAFGHGFAAAWSETDDAGTRLLFARLDAAGRLREPARALSADPDGADDHEPALALGPRGHGAVAWCRDAEGKHEIRVRTFGPEGGLLEQDVLVARHAAYHLPALAVDEDGEVLVAWLELGMPLAARLAADGAVLDAPHRVPWNGLPALGRPRVLFGQDEVLEVARIHVETGAATGWTVSARPEYVPGPGRIEPGALESHWRGSARAGWYSQSTAGVAASFVVGGTEEHRLYRDEQGFRLQSVFGTLDVPPFLLDHRFELDADERLQIYPLVERSGGYRGARGFFLLRSGPGGSALQRQDVMDDFAALDADVAWTVPLTSLVAHRGPRIAADGARLLIGWTEKVGERDRARFRLVRDGGELGEVQNLEAPHAPEPLVDQCLLQLTAAPGQGFAALWSETVGERTRLLFGRLDADAALREPARELSAAPDADDHEPAIALGAEGHGAVAWCREVEVGHAVLARCFAPDGALLGRDVRVAVREDARLPALALDGEGEVLLAWLRGGSVHAGRLDASGAWMDEPHQVLRDAPPAIARPVVLYSTGTFDTAAHIHVPTGELRGVTTSLHVDALRELEIQESSSFHVRRGELHRLWGADEATVFRDGYADHRVEIGFGFGGDRYDRLLRGEDGVRVMTLWALLSMHPGWVDYLVTDDPAAEVWYWPGYLMQRGPDGFELQGYDLQDIPGSFGYAFGPPLWEPPVSPFGDRVETVMHPGLAADGATVLLAWTEERHGRGVVFLRTVNAAGELGEARRLDAD